MPLRGLLDRIASSGAVDRNPDAVAAVVEHLRVLLNTRRGGSPAAVDFGLVDLADLVHVFPAGAQVLQRTIRDTILTYEPRLSNVTVRHIPGDQPLTLKFEIGGQVLDRRNHRAIKLTTQVSAGGHVDVW